METITYVNRTMTDADGQVHDIDYSLDGQSMLVISGTLYPKIFNKEGEDE
jgi:hypothetical protein